MKMSHQRYLGGTFGQQIEIILRRLVFIKLFPTRMWYLRHRHLGVCNLWRNVEQPNELFISFSISSLPGIISSGFCVNCYSLSLRVSDLSNLV